MPQNRKARERVFMAHLKAETGIEEVKRMCAAAGMRPYQTTSPPPPPFDNQFIVDLLRMRKDGIFSGLWMDSGIIRVCIYEGPRTKITEAQARALIAQWKGQPLVVIQKQPVARYARRSAA
jgi:hypothetical protein